LHITFRETQWLEDPTIVNPPWDFPVALCGITMVDVPKLTTNSPGNSLRHPIHITSPAPQLQLWMASYTERGGLLKLAASMLSRCPVPPRYLPPWIGPGGASGTPQKHTKDSPYGFPLWIPPMDSPFLVDFPFKKKTLPLK